MVYIVAREAADAQQVADRRGLPRQDWCYVWSPHLLAGARGVVWKVGPWDARLTHRQLTTINSSIRANRLPVELIDG